MLYLADVELFFMCLMMFFLGKLNSICIHDGMDGIEAHSIENIPKYVRNFLPFFYISLFSLFSLFFSLHSPLFSPSLLFVMFCIQCSQKKKILNWRALFQFSPAFHSVIFIMKKVRREKKSLETFFFAFFSII